MWEDEIEFQTSQFLGPSFYGLCRVNLVLRTLNCHAVQLFEKKVKDLTSITSMQTRK